MTSPKVSGDLFLAHKGSKDKTNSHNKSDRVVKKAYGGASSFLASDTENTTGSELKNKKIAYI